MREIRTLRSMSGDGKQGGAEWPEPLRPSSTLRVMAGIRRRVSRKLLIVFMDWVSKPSLHTIMPSHTRHV